MVCSSVVEMVASKVVTMVVVKAGMSADELVDVLAVVSVVL